MSEIGKINHPDQGEARPSSRFTEEERAELEKQNYKIYELSGQSMASRGMLFGGASYIDLVPEEHGLYGVEQISANDLESLRSEVAFNPDNFFIEDSNLKSLDQQSQMIKDFNKSLNLGRAVIGGIAEYSEIALRYFEDTGKVLFNERMVITGSSANRVSPAVYLPVNYAVSAEEKESSLGKKLDLNLHLALFKKNAGFVAPLILPEARGWTRDIIAK